MGNVCNWSFLHFCKNYSSLNISETVEDSAFKLSVLVDTINDLIGNFQNLRLSLNLAPKEVPIFQWAPYLAALGRQIYVHIPFPLYHFGRILGPLENVWYPGHQPLTDFVHRAWNIANFRESHFFGGSHPGATCWGLHAMFS